VLLRNKTPALAETLLVSVVILNYNGRRLLEDCVESVLRQDYPNLEVIMADNASDDDSVEYIKTRYPDVRVIEYPENCGFSSGNNKAARQATGQYLFFLNNDTRLDTHCISELVDAAVYHDADIYGCSVTDFEGSMPPRIMGCDFMGFPFRGRFFYVEGCAFFIRRDAFFELAGFDEDYFMFYEDLDICWRARLMGMVIRYVDAAIVRHLGGATLSGGNPEYRGYTTNYQRRYLGERNNMRTLLKNYKLLTLLLVLPVYFLMNIFEVIALIILGGNLKAANCYLRAYLDNLRYLPHIIVKRRKVQKSRVVGDLEIIRCMSLFPFKLKMLLKVGLPEIKS